MDPNACLAEIRAITTNFEAFDHYAALRLAELVDAMDDWMTCGGFAPTDWAVSDV